MARKKNPTSALCNLASHEPSKSSFYLLSSMNEDGREGVELPLVQDKPDAQAELLTTQVEDSKGGQSNRAQYVAFATVMWTMFLEGWSDGSPGE